MGLAAPPGDGDQRFLLIYLSRISHGTSRVRRTTSAKRSKPVAASQATSPRLRRGLREAGGIVAGAAALYLLLALASYAPSDPATPALGAEVLNRGGTLGASLAHLLLRSLGAVAYLVPLALLGYVAALLARSPHAGGRFDLPLRLGAALLALAGACGLATLLNLPTGQELPAGGGGALGAAIAGRVSLLLSPTGGALLLLAATGAAIGVATPLSWLRLFETVGSGAAWAGGQVKRAVPLLGGRAGAAARGALGRLGSVRQALRWRRQRSRPAPSPPRAAPTATTRPTTPPPVAAAPSAPRIRLPAPRVEPKPMPSSTGNGAWALPLSLLEAPDEVQESADPEALAAIARLVEEKLADFGVEVRVVGVHPGPVITRFELQPAAGVKVSQISNLSKDLARSLSAISVRVVEVIPGRPYVGLEIPNSNRQLVYLSEILSSERYRGMLSPLAISLGQDIGGQPVVADLAKMPHLLVAGTTGSGKSVAINAMLLSLLYKSSPQQVRLILIDPKMLELSVYDGIAHLLAPVVTDMADAANALRWCVAEMERRYKLMAQMGVRNVAGLNRKVAEAQQAGKPLFAPETEQSDAPEVLDPLPLIVVVVDELADLMMVVGKKVEELIARLAQKARAAGIHLVLATQRPSVDVITGLIKANIPTRIAFQVSSKIDSRTILDQMGAEALLGHGDMLYLPPGTGHPQRVHGAFVDDHEVHQVTEHLRTLGAPAYVDDVLTGPAEALLEGGGGEPDGEADPLYDQAVQIVTESRKASISYVQRRLRVGYNRAARLVEQMEYSGVVGALQANGSRDVIAPAPPELD